MSTTSEDQPLKITPTLPASTVSKLDAIAKNSLLRTRGTVIQSLVDKVLHVRTTMSKVEQPAKSMEYKHQSSAWAAVLSLSIAVSDISK